MSLMIPTDSAEGVMHTSNEDWGETGHTWSSNSRPLAWGWLSLGSTPQRWTAGRGRRRTWRSLWRAIIVAEGNNTMMGPSSLSPPPSIYIPPTMLPLSYSPVALLLRPFKPGVGGGIDKMTPKEGESDWACWAISFFGGGGLSLVVVS